MKTTTLAILTVAVAFVTGCGQARAWPADGAPDLTAEPGKNRVVLFAPVEIGPLANSYPEAKIQFARDLSARMDLLYDNTQSWFGETLPVSSDARWDQGAVGSAAGAHVVVLTEILDITEQKAGAGFTPMIQATVRMRGINAKGEQIYLNELTGKAPNETPAKIMGEGAKPEPKASWEACKKLLSGFGAWVEAQPLPEPGEIWNPSDRDQAPLVDVVIDSTPAGADIFVDGVFRGTTPSSVPIPVRPLTLKLQRQGYQVWEQEFTPEAGIRIAPGLEPLSGTEPAPAPAPAPKAE